MNELIKLIPINFILSFSLKLVLSFVLGLIIAYIYKKTHKGLSYSQSFVYSLVLICIIITVIMSVIGFSIVYAIGVIGAISIIRFRTVIKDTKDIAFILFALAIGLAIGTDNFSAAIVATFFISIIIFVLTKYDFGSFEKYDYLITFSLNTKQTDTAIYKETFKKHLKRFSLLDVKAKENGQILDHTINIEFFDSNKISDFIKELSNLQGLSNVELLSAKNDIEY